MEIQDARKTSFLIEENHRNVHTLKSFYDKDLLRSIFLLSDPHWDNKKTDLELLKKHLDQAVDRNAKILINGDLFCLMQGKWDKRASKSGLRKEHWEDDYFDAIVRTAVEWFGPYVNHIAVVGRGNHEQSIIKHHHTDILQRFVDQMNLTYRPEQKIKMGGYGGWVRFVFDREESYDKKVIKLKYYHGAGKDAEVTMGMIGNHRRQSFIQGADIIWTGHIHNNVSATFVYETINDVGNVIQKETEHLITSTYKEEYQDGHSGFHVERGARPKPLGGAWLEFYYEKNDIKFRHYRAK